MKIASIYSNLKYLISHRPLPIEKPTVLQFPVIDICNSKCQMCRIWENKKSKDISVQQLRTGLRNPLYSEVVGVGINGGEPTLRDDLADLVRVLFEELPKIKGISFISNGYKSSQVIDRITEIGKVIKQHDGYLDVMISLDGYGDIHDKVRGRTGNFKNAQLVIDFLKSCDFVDNIRIGCTVIKENVYHLPELLEFCIKNDLYVKYRLGIPHQRLYTQNLLDPYSLTFAEKYELTEFLENIQIHYEKSDYQNFFYKSLIGQVMHNQPRRAGCDWQHRGATITAKGELLYCAVQSKVLLDDIAKGDSEKAYFDNRPHQIDIFNSKCSTCNHDYVGVPPKDEYIKILIKKINEKYSFFSYLKKTIFFDIALKSRKIKKFKKRVDFYHSIIGALPATKLPSDSRKKILICGWYGTETLGDKGIISGVMHALKNIYGNDVLFFVASLYPYISEMTKLQMPEFNNCTIIDIQEAVKLASLTDLTVFGGGPLMGIDELAEMEAIFSAAKSNQRCTMIAGCGVGPFGHKKHNLSLSNILNMSDIRIYRDERSRQYAKELGVNIEADIVAEDPAFTWLNSIKPQLYLSKNHDDKKILLLGLRDFPYKEYARHLTESESLKIKDEYEFNVVKALEIIVKKQPGIVIKPLPMCTNHFGADDRWFYRRLFRDNKLLEHNLDLSLLCHEMPPIEYCKAFKEANVLLAMRFHSLVFGIGLGVPSIGLDYTLGKGKVRSLAERYDVPFLSLAKIDVDKLVSLIEQQLMNDSVQPLSPEKITFMQAMANDIATKVKI